MTPVRDARRLSRLSLRKCPTGIQGLDEITLGGLPRGRATLLCGGAGSGKTLLAMEFLVRGAVAYQEPGVFVAFEELPRELVHNFASLGFDLDRLKAQKLLKLEHVYIERSEIEVTGQYDLEGLFIRLGHALDSVHAKRVVLDTIEALFSGFDNEAILRAELRRLFRWLKSKGVTAVVTGESGREVLTKYGLEEYVADCVIFLDSRLIDQIATRRLRIVKYRGSRHAPGEFPFQISAEGISVLPITSNTLDHKVPRDRISAGLPDLDRMLGGQGYYRGSTVLVTGTAGTGKTSFAAHFADAACRRGEQCLWLAFEESQDQIVRNMRSIGLDLLPWIQKGRLHLLARRPTIFGLEMHLLEILRLVRENKPSVVVVDPVSNFTASGIMRDVRAMLARLMDSLKSQRVTALLTNLTSDPNRPEETEVGISSLVDTWVVLRCLECEDTQNRSLCILKSRGMQHSAQIQPFEITSQGVQLKEV